MLRKQHIKKAIYSCRNNHTACHARHRNVKKMSKTRSKSLLFILLLFFFIFKVPHGSSTCTQRVSLNEIWGSSMMMDAMCSHACRSLKLFLADSAWNIPSFMMAPSNVFKLILSMFKCMGTPWELHFILFLL